MPYLAENMPEYFTSMGLTAENVVANMASAARIRMHFLVAKPPAGHCGGRIAVVFDPEIVPVEVKIVRPGENGDQLTKTFVFERDEGPRADTTLEALGKAQTGF